MTLKTAYDFIKNAGVYYLATIDSNKPKVRPFGTIDLFEDKLYVQTGRCKNVAKQIEANPNVELSAFNNGNWIRLSGLLVADERVEAKKHMLDQYPDLRGMYDENDSNTMVFYFKNGHISIESFGGPKEELDF